MTADWSTLSAEVKGNEQQGGSRCTVGRFLQTIPADQLDEVDATVMNRDLSAAALARAIRSRIGSDAPTAWSIGNHRRSSCRCWKDQG